MVVLTIFFTCDNGVQSVYLWHEVSLPLIQIFRNIQGGMDDPCNCHGFASDSIQNDIVIDGKDM